MQLKMVPLKCAILVSWMFLEYTRQEDKRYPILSPQNLSGQSRRFLTHPGSHRAPTVKPIRVLIFTPTSRPSLPLRLLHPPPRSQEQVLLAVVLVLVVGRSPRLQDPSPMVRELLSFLFSQSFSALHSLPFSLLRRCMCSNDTYDSARSLRVGPYGIGTQCMGKLGRS